MAWFLIFLEVDADAMRPILLAMVLLASTITLLPSASACGETLPCLRADWFGCEGGNIPPQLSCRAVCYTSWWDPTYPEEFWFSETICIPLLGNDE